MSRVPTSVIPEVRVPTSLSDWSFGVGGAGAETVLFHGPRRGFDDPILRALLNGTLEQKAPNGGGIAYLFTPARRIGPIREPVSWLELVKSRLDPAKFRVGGSVTVPGTNVAMTAVTRIATVAMIAGLSLLAFTGTAEAQSPNQKAREEGNDPALKFSASAALAAVAALFFFIRGTRENRAFPRNWFVAGALALVTNVLAYYACKRLTAANKT